MTRNDTISDAVMMDFVEGRLSKEDRATVVSRIRSEPELARKCERVRAHAINIGLLRAVLPVERVPQDWLDILERRKPG